MPNLTQLFLALGTAAYSAAFLLTLFRLIRRRRPVRDLNYVVVLLGWAAQTVGVWMLGMEAQACPIRNPFEVLQFVSWSVVVVYLFTGKVFRLSLFGTGCASLAALLSVLAFAFVSTYGTSESLRLSDNPWMEAHAAIALFSYGVFGLLAVVAALFLIQHASLKRKSTSNWTQQLPSIVDMEAVLGRLLYLGTIIFSIAMLIGAYGLLQLSEPPGIFKLAFTNSLWIAYIAAAAIHASGRLFGTRLAITCIVLYITALFILWPVEVDRSLPQNAAAALNMTVCPHVV